MQLDTSSIRVLPSQRCAPMPQRHLRVIAQAMLEAKMFDPRRTASGLLSVIEVLIDDDPIGREIFATLLRELARKFEGNEC